MAVMEYKKIWEKLVYQGFSEFDLKLREVRENIAVKVIEALYSGNVILAAGMGAGKTIISILIALVSEKPVLFITPRRFLTKEQHVDAYYKMTGKPIGKGDVRIITGEIAPERRIWSHPPRITFATREVVAQDMKAGRLRLTDFGLIIMDEIHLMGEDDAFAFVALRAFMHNVRVLALSGTPGRSVKNWKMIKKSLFLHRGHVVYAPEINLPPITMNYQKAEPTPELLEAEKLLLDLREKALKEFIDLNLPLADCHGLIPGKTVSFHKMENLKKSVREYARGGEFFRINSWLVSYNRSAYFRRVLLGESYTTLLASISETKSKKSISARWLSAQPELMQVIEIAQNHLHAHPTIERLIKVAKSYAGAMKKTVIIFAYERETVRYITERLQQEGVAADYVVGRGKRREIPGMTTVEMRAVYERLARKEIYVVVSTTVSEVGVAIPEVDAVFNYSLPATADSWLQRMRRAGRVRTGLFIAFMIDLPNIVEKVARLVRTAQGIEDRLKDPETVPDPSGQLRLLYS